MARDPRLHRNLLYLRLARPRGALGFGVRSDAVPDSDDLTPAAARARWHRVRPKPRRTAVAHSPACLAHELGNRTQPHTKRRTPASFDSIVRSGTLTHGGSWTLLGHPWFGFGSPDLGTTELRQRGAVRHIWVSPTPPRLGVGPGSGAVRRSGGKSVDGSRRSSAIRRSWRWTTGSAASSTRRCS